MDKYVVFVFHYSVLVGSFALLAWLLRLFWHTSILTKWGLSDHWLKKLFVAWLAPSHYLNKCWLIVNWTLWNKFQWNLNRNMLIFIQDNAFENVFCWVEAILLRLQYVKHKSLLVNKQSPLLRELIQPNSNSDHWTRIDNMSSNAERP